MARTRSTTRTDPRNAPFDTPQLDRRRLFRGVGAAGLFALGGGLVVPVEVAAAEDSLKAVQTGLQGLDYYDGKIDGVGGPVTEEATERFQEDRLLAVDGDPGPKTAAELEAVIGQVQEALEVEASGSFGEATTDAVTTFQESEADLEATGRADEATMKALGVERVKTPVGGEPNSEISRKDVIERAMFWVDDPRPYSQKGTSVGIDGRKWRRDCSGFASMAWNLRRSDGDSGTTTGKLPEVLERIEKEDLTTGDALLITPSANGKPYGHVVLFNGWKDEEKTQYEGLEQAGKPHSGTVRRTIPYPYDDQRAFDPYRYPKITD